MPALSLEEAYAQASERGRWFSVEFVKRDNSRRKMICRRGVTSHIKGGGLKFDPDKYDLMTVFDAQKKEYRMVPTDPNRVIRVTGRGQVLFENPDALELLEEE